MAKKKSFQISDALTVGLEETITAAHHYSGELRIDIIPLKKIEVDPENPRDLILSFKDIYDGIFDGDINYTRKKAELESLQTLANSIRDQGIINPIVVYKHGEKYRLVAGERRTLGSIIAGMIDIQAKILDSKPNDLKISLLQWIENVERADLSIWERLRNLEKIVHTFTIKKGITAADMTITDLSHLIGCSKPHAMNYKAVLLANPTLKELIKTNKIKNLEKAALLSSIEDLSMQDELIQACLNGASLKKLKLLTKQVCHQPIIQKSSKPTEKRGRQSSCVNLGITKNLTVAKSLFTAIFEHGDLTPNAINVNHINWDDYKSVTQAFKDLVKKLEETYE
jgi:ParB family chromosome partitioning protein